MGQTLLIIEIVLAILLIACILMQHQGTSLGGTFGGEGNVYRSRRGAERYLFIFTVVLACLFVIVALLKVIVK